MAPRIRKGWKGDRRAWTLWLIARRPCDVKDLLARYFQPCRLDVEPGGPFACPPRIKRNRNTVRITQRGGLDD
jgi:hypothetical protein